MAALAKSPAPASASGGWRERRSLDLAFRRRKATPFVHLSFLRTTEKADVGLFSGTTASGGAPSQLTSTYLTLLLMSGALRKHIHTVLLPAYSRRYQVLVRAITTHLLPIGFTLAAQPGREVVGGYFVWLALPKSMSADELAERCKLGAGDGEGVIIASGSIFEVPGDEEAARFDDHFRLCFAWEEESRLEEGVRRIAMAAKAVLMEAEGEAGKGLREGYVVVEKRQCSGGDVGEYK